MHSYTIPQQLKQRNWELTFNHQNKNPTFTRVPASKTMKEQINHPEEQKGKKINYSVMISGAQKTPKKKKYIFISMFRTKLTKEG